MNCYATRKTTIRKPNKNLNWARSKTDPRGQRTLIVADSSFIVESLIKNKELLADQQIITPELITHEVTNAIWKHEHILKDIANGKQYISIFYGLMETGKAKTLNPNEELRQQTYSIAKRQGITIYDAVFVSLAIKLGLPLKSYDRVQIRALETENSHR